MSSFIGHTLIGYALGTRKQIGSTRDTASWLFPIGLAISPDIDYLALWLLGYRGDVRYTHSIGYCLLGALLVWGIKAFILPNFMDKISVEALFMASFSHLILDLLVGVHPMPLFWPLNSRLIVLPLGILPSAAHINVKNYYFWRNLFIELGQLLPMTMLIVPRFRAKLCQSNRLAQVLIVVLFVTSIWIGISLSR